MHEYTHLKSRFWVLDVPTFGPPLVAPWSTPFNPLLRFLTVFDQKVLFFDQKGSKTGHGPGSALLTKAGVKVKKWSKHEKTGF